MPSARQRKSEQQKIQFEMELQRMIKSRWNHPSIVDWTIFNEHWGAYDVQPLTHMALALDPSRLITDNSGMDAGSPNLDYEVGNMKDNHHYRPPTNPATIDRRAAVNGELAENEKFFSMLVRFREENNLSGAVYTQWTDVDNEMNGIYTYDRKVVKLVPARVTKANRSTWAQQ